VRGPLQRLRDTRVTLSQLMLVSLVSGAASAAIVVSALGQTGTERAVIAALRTRQVIHATGPGYAPARAPVAPAPAIADPASNPPASAASGGNGGGSGAAAPSAAPGSTGGANGDGSGSTGGSASSDSSAPAGSSRAAGATARTGSGSQVKHLFVIVLSTPSYAAAFGRDTPAHYLNAKLRPKGELLSQYHTLGGSPLPDYLAMISGQPPNRDTRTGCPVYSEFPSSAAPAKNGRVRGVGCVYPNTALTLGDQMDGAALRWRAYIGGMSSPCQHPNSGAGADATANAAGVNPFIYFHSLLDLGDCQSDDLAYGRLATALGSARRTPSYAFISPDACDSGATAACPAGSPTGLAAADAFLQRVVPSILRSPAYRAGGALLVVFATAGSPPPATPAAAPSGATTTAAPATTVATTPTSTTGAGAPAPDAPVRTGALILSAHTKPGSIDARPYNPYAVLRSVEDVFGLSALAGARSARGFDGRAFSRR
jgi:hypothetical protein